MCLNECGWNFLSFSEPQKVKHETNLGEINPTDIKGSACCGK